ncbi:SGNH/GDSL hydrolase family protein [Novacetimonas pomaceti]|nr:SGNH/GDSL hydrolase family protein [Novacetimonas pomaceti]
MTRARKKATAMKKMAHRRTTLFAALALATLPRVAWAQACPDAGDGTQGLCMPATDAASAGMDRAPGAHDDARAGYRAGDLWQAHGQVWQADSVTAGQARWTRMTPTRPADTFGAHALFAGGPMRMVSGYHGPALDVEVTQGGQPAVVTIGIGADGDLDHAALRAALARRDGGTFANVVRVYDQSGHGNHLLATPQHVVHVGEVRIAGHDAISWGEANGPGGFILPAGVRVRGDGFFFGTTGTYASSNSGFSAFPVPVLLGEAGQKNTFKLFFGSYSLDGFAHVADGMDPDHRTDLVVMNSPAAVSVYGDHDGYHLDAANSTGTYMRGAMPTGMLSGGYVGYNADGGEWFVQGRNTGQWTGMVIADVAPRREQVRAFQAAAAVAGDYMPQLRSVFVAIGDSRTEGYLLADGRNWPYLMQRHGRYQSYDFGVSGATTRQMVGMLPAAEAAGRNASSRVAVVFGGVNDHLPYSHIPVDETLRNLAQITRRLKAAGFHVVIIAEANTTGAPRAEIQKAIDSHMITVDAEIDPFAPGQPMADVGDRTYWFADYTHPSQHGHWVLSETVWKRVGGWLMQPARN